MPAKATSAITIRSGVFSSWPTDSLTMAATISSDTRFITFSSGLIEGPAVSLNGSPTVSPMTVAAWASDPLPPWWPSSTSFLALSQAPPELARNTAISVPDPIAPARKPARVVTPRPKPTATGASTAKMPGVTSSRRESLVTMSTTLPYSGRPVPSMMPGISRNWRRTSKTTAPAARPTALTARPAERTTTAAPTGSPTRFAGSTMLMTPNNAKISVALVSGETPVRLSVAPCTASVNEPNSAVAARTAVAIAIPLVIALVVLPTASSSVRIAAPFSSTSPDISAMPWALSETGPNVSMATITPTVVSRPQPARATANSEIATTPEPSRKAPNTAAPITSAVNTADSNPTDRPERITVAAPVIEVLPTSITGRWSVPV